MEKLLFKISWLLLAAAILIIPAVGREAISQGPWQILIVAVAAAAIGIRLWILRKTKQKKTNKAYRYKFR